jgi:hypothetical protein
MKWNDVEMIDGKFYFVEVERWLDNEPNEWVFMFKDNNENCITRHYCSAKITNDSDSHCAIYDYGFICDDSKILGVRPATQEDMGCFYKYLQKWDYRFNLNTKKLRHVERG